ncbi:MAG TPA: ABC transporter substrate-binding protein [Casimicrobiaceae bacterium]|jgi:branched-chain amino acid transport system substrate-binding protein|nr:ABC transporter substrate-binding protein [Casimicrobiaceae bacterium]
MTRTRLLLAALSLALAASAYGAVNVGVTLSATGPAASLGIPEKNTFELIGEPVIAGQKVHFIILDDKSDTTEAVKNTRKLISEDKVDVIIGSTVTPNSLAMRDVVAEAEVPMISMAASAQIIAPNDAKTHWVFKTPQNDSLMADAIAVHMRAGGVRTMGFIGFADAYGDSWLNEMRRSAQTAGIQIVAEEKYNRNDTSVTGQVLKLLAANPDAILIAGSGTPAATPHKDLVARGYKGRIYQTHGVANADFLRVVGADGNGAFLPAGPLLVVEQLPESNAVKKSAAEYVTRYESKYGPGSRTTFGGHAWDAYVLLQRAIPEALKRGQPGTQAFRSALRDALENAHEVAASNGVFNITPGDHNGMDNRARVMVRIDNGKWLLVK